MALPMHVTGTIAEVQETLIKWFDEQKLAVWKSNADAAAARAEHEKLNSRAAQTG